MVKWLILLGGSDHLFNTRQDRQEMPSTITPFFANMFPIRRSVVITIIMEKERLESVDGGDNIYHHYEIDILIFSNC